MVEGEIFEKDRTTREYPSRNGVGKVLPETGKRNDLQVLPEEIKTIAEIEEYPYNF